MREVLRVAAAMLAMAGCSLGITPVASDWDGTTEPECDDSYALVAMDSVAAGIATGVALGGIDQENDVAAGVGLATALTFSIGALIGETRVRGCREAKATWRIGGAIGRASVNNTPVAQTRREIEQEERLEIERRRRAEREAARARAVPRGHFCSTSPSSPTAGICTRQKPDCARARDAALGAVPDLTECTLVETAWCFTFEKNERCFPGEDSCSVAQERAQLGAGPSVVGLCAEAK